MWTWWAAAIISLLAACSKESPRRQYIARVDQDVLTEDDLVAGQDSLTLSSRRRNEYINEWVNTELLYQEAKNRGWADDPGIRRDVEEARKKLAIAALLQHEVYRDVNVSDDEIVAMYNGGGEAFRLSEDVVNVSFALFGDRDAANVFRGKLIGGTAWNAAVSGFRKDSLFQSRLGQTVDRQFFTQSTLYPPELWKLARNLGKEEVSFAAKIGGGYYILVLHSMKKQGELPELDYIRNEIRTRITIERRRLEYDRLLASLRSKHSVDVRVSESDTTVHATE